MSDRTLVMHEGRLAGQLTQSELNEEAVMRLATGLWYGRRTNPARFEMKKVIGIFVLLIVVCIITTVINPTFLRPYNIENTGLKYLATGRPFSCDQYAGHRHPAGIRRHRGRDPTSLVADEVIKRYAARRRANENNTR